MTNARSASRPGVILRASERSGQANNSGKIAHNPVGSIGNDNLGVFTVTEIAMKITNAAPPMHLIPSTPDTAYLNL
jgi:hypothetical protein